MSSRIFLKVKQKTEINTQITLKISSICPENTTVLNGLKSLSRFTRHNRGIHTARVLAQPVPPSLLRDRFTYIQLRVFIKVIAQTKTLFPSFAFIVNGLVGVFKI